jgi:hypothetical protein
MSEQEHEFSTILSALADVAEDLAIELIAEFSEDEMVYLDKTCSRLQVAATKLSENNHPVPFPVKELLKLWKKRQKAQTGNQSETS